MSFVVEGDRVTIAGRTGLTVVVGCALLLLGACAAKPFVNEPLSRWSQAQEQRVAQLAQGGRDSETLVLLAFSGGGTRAAAFAYGVMKELAATTIVTPQGERRLLDEVDVISSVSGGSFPNAYYALYGDRIFEDFEARFLRVDIQSELEKRLFTKSGQLGSGHFGRSDMAAQLYDERLFDGRTFADCYRSGAPLAIINSTDIAAGMRIAFNPTMFGLLCADLDSYPVSRAVAASSAVPGLATPITLQNFAGQCGFDADAWLDPSAARPSLTAIEAQGLRAYLNVSDRPWLHLVDGGISDNLGLRAFYTVLSLEQNPERVLKHLGHENVNQILLISVNAATHHYPEWGRESKPPNAKNVLASVTDVLMSRYTHDTTYIVRNAYKNWSESKSSEGTPLNFEFVDASFAQVTSPLERQRLNDTATSFQLEDHEVDRLIRAGREVLRQSNEYQQFVLRNKGPLATQYSIAFSQSQGDH